MNRKIILIFRVFLLTSTCMPRISYAQWRQVPLRTQAQKTASLAGGEGFQQVMSIAIAPSNPNIVYLCSDTSKVWKSTDGGTTWTPKGSGIVALGCASLAVDPTNANKVFLASIVGQHMPFAGGQNGIYRTTNGGDTWTLVKSTNYSKPSGEMGGVDFTFTTTGTIYAGTHEDGLMKSTDGGATFSQVVKSGGGYILDGIRITDVKVHPIDNTIIFVSSDGGFYKVADSGSSAAQTKITLPNNTYPLAAAIHPTNGSIIYLTVNNYGVYKTTNGGTTWSTINNGLTTALSAGKSARFIAISPADPNYLFVGFNRKSVFYTHDAGSTWVEPASMDESNADGWIAGSLGGYDTDPKANYWMNPMAVHPTDKNIAFTSGDGGNIRKTTDGGVDWRYSATGYTGGLAGFQMTKTGMSNISFDRNNSSRFGMFLVDAGPFLTEDGGGTFRNMRIPRYLSAKSTMGGAIAPNSNTIITAVGDWQTRQIAITRNANATNPTWDLISGTERDWTYCFFAFHPGNSNIAYADTYKFTNIQNNNTYTTLSKGVVAMYQGNGDIVYSWDAAPATNYFRIFKSTNGGSAWTNPYPDIPVTYANNDVGQITVDPKNQDKIYVAVKNKGIYIINGSTLSLKNEANGLSKSRFNSIDTLYVTADPNNTNILYAGYYKAWIGNSSGIFRSIDGGNSWVNITDNLGSEFTPMYLTVKPDNSYVYVGSSLGTWKLPPPGTAVSQDTTSPSIAITSPTSSATCSATNSSISLSGTASDNIGVSAVGWTNSANSTSGTASGTTSWSVAGIALVSGSNTITVTAKDAAGNSSSDTITVTYATAISAPVITSALSAAGTVGTVFSYQITAANSPTSFNAAGLPAGLSVSTGTGRISGTPTTVGTSSVTISAANASGTGVSTLTLSVYYACDLNRDASTNVVDVQLQVNAALGVTACASDLNRDGSCNVIDVQRGVNASLGGPCLLGP